MFSLILATYDRTDELRIFLDSLLLQTYKQFELIIADQNNDDRILSIRKAYEPFFQIIHIRTPKGLSRSRNAALKMAKGTFVAFPDDDCTYSKELLENVAAFFQQYAAFDGLSVLWRNSLDNGLVPVPHFESGELAKEDVIGLVCSISIFFRKTVLDKIGGFDENMGLGSGTIYNGAEDYEIVMRMIHQGFRFYFKSEYEVFHPKTTIGNAVSAYQKQRIVGAGATNYVLYKKYLGISRFYKGLVKHLLGAGLNFVRSNNEGYVGHLYRLKGLLSGKANYNKYFNKK